MPESINWEATTYEGNRRRQHEEFRALPFREKLQRIEAMQEVAARLAESRHRKVSRNTTDQTSG